MSESALLALADGTLFKGRAVGIKGSAPGEVVFNTSMTGYQEILTDPSYAQQIVTLTYPHIGNVGCNAQDAESSNVWPVGLVIRDLPRVLSNWRSEISLSDYLKQHGVVGIADIDTRALTRRLREKGALSGCIMAGSNIDDKAAIEAARDFPGLKGADLAQVVTTEKAYHWKEGLSAGHDAIHTSQSSLTHHVVVYDFGVKRNILRSLVNAGCRFTVVPATTSVKTVLALRPSGVLLSNGPGDPEPCEYAITAIRALLAAGVPILGICLGMQLLALSCGAKTQKMKFGHHGANHPIQELATQRVLITSQNHGFMVADEGLPSEITVTHRSLFDGSIQGIAHRNHPAIAFQGHPEASPGPHDLSFIFKQFIDLMNAEHINYAKTH